MSAPGARGRAHRLRIRSRWWAGAVVVGLLGASGTGAQAPNDAEGTIRGDLEDADRRMVDDEHHGGGAEGDVR